MLSFLFPHVFLFDDDLGRIDVRDFARGLLGVQQRRRRGREGDRGVPGGGEGLDRGAHLRAGP